MWGDLQKQALISGFQGFVGNYCHFHPKNPNLVSLLAFFGRAPRPYRFESVWVSSVSNFLKRARSPQSSDTSPCFELCIIISAGSESRGVGAGFDLFWEQASLVGAEWNSAPRLTEELLGAMTGPSEKRAASAAQCVKAFDEYKRRFSLGDDKKISVRALSCEREFLCVNSTLNR
jgi:hypothetical protein